MRTEKEWYALIRGWYYDLANLSDFDTRPANTRITVQTVVKGMREILDAKGKRE